MKDKIKDYTWFCKDKNLKIILEKAARAAFEAGEVLKSYYGKPVTINYKGKIDLVTQADLASEETLLEILKKEMPEAEILSEESPSFPPSLSPQGGGWSEDSHFWIIDPLDGTTNFAHGFPWFAISIAFCHKDRVQVGIVYAPLQDEFFCAAHNQGAWLNGETVKVSSASSLKTSLLATGFPYDIHDAPKNVMGALEAILTRAQGVRRAGAAAMDLAYVSCGRLDGFWEIKLKPWDTAAGKLLVEEAGGMITDFKEDYYTPFIPEILATNRLIHTELVQILREFSEF